MGESVVVESWLEGSMGDWLEEFVAVESWLEGSMGDWLEEFIGG